MLLSLVKEKKPVTENEDDNPKSFSEEFNFLDLSPVEYSFFFGGKEVSELVYQGGEKFHSYSLFGDKSRSSPLLVKRGELAFSLHYGTPFILPRFHQPFPEIFIVYTLPSSREKAKRDIDNFREKLGPESNFILIATSEEKSIVFSFLEELKGIKEKVVLAEDNLEYHVTKELLKLARGNSKRLILQVGLDLARQGNIEEEIFSTLLDKKWIEAFNQFPSLNKLTWKGSKEGYAWYNVYWVKASYILTLKEPKRGKCGFYYTKWLAGANSPRNNHDTLQTCSEKCNLGEHYFN